MSYADQAAIATDPQFVARLGACVQKEARTKDDAVANLVLTGSIGAVQMFLPFVTTEPGFDIADQGAISDAMLLAAVQTVWPLVVDAHATTP